MYWIPSKVPSYRLINCRISLQIVSYTGSTGNRHMPHCGTTDIQTVPQRAVHERGGCPIQQYHLAVSGECNYTRSVNFNTPMYLYTMFAYLIVSDKHFKYVFTDMATATTERTHTLSHVIHLKMRIRATRHTQRADENEIRASFKNPHRYRAFASTFT